MGPETVKIRLTGHLWRTPELDDEDYTVEAQPNHYEDHSYRIVSQDHRFENYNVLVEGHPDYGMGWGGCLIPDIPFKSNWAPVGVAVEDLIVPLTDEINPEHYQFPGKNGPVQVIDITKHLGFLEGNVIKYVARAGRKTKNPLTDLLKAQKYLGLLIEKTEEENR